MTTWLDAVAQRLHLSRAETLASMAILLIAVVEILVVGAFLTRSFTSPPPLAYDRPSYLATEVNVCPGDTLRWIPTLTVRDAGHIELSRTIWDVNRSIHARTADGLATEEIRLGRNYPPELAGQPRANAAALVVPDLLPGPYRVVTVTWGVETGQAIYTVEFVVKGDC